MRKKRKNTQNHTPYFNLINSNANASRNKKHTKKILSLNNFIENRRRRRKKNNQNVRQIAKEKKIIVSTDRKESGQKKKKMK